MDGLKILVFYFVEMIIIHSLKDCYYCEKAKEFLKEIEQDYTEIHYDKNSEDYKERVDELLKVTNYNKFPQIFIDEEFIGGYQDLVERFDF